MSGIAKHGTRQYSPPGNGSTRASGSHLLPLDLPGHWIERAACGDRRDNLFFPDATDRAQITEAKAICARCPVRHVCLDWAVRTGQDGIWGGLTEEERRPLRRRYLEGSV